MINDNNAIGVMAAAHSLNLCVPDDLSLVGYNDIPVVSRLSVPLTTIRVPFPQIAANALELLREAGNDSPPRTLIAAPTLIPRESTVAYTSPTRPELFLQRLRRRPHSTADAARLPWPARRNQPVRQMAAQGQQSRRDWTRV